MTLTEEEIIQIFSLKAQNYERLGMPLIANSVLNPDGYTSIRISSKADVGDAYGSMCSFSKESLRYMTWEICNLNADKMIAVIAKLTKKTNEGPIVYTGLGNDKLLLLYAGIAKRELPNAVLAGVIPSWVEELNTENME